MTISGTKEWSVHSVNCCNGCSHNCRYCYAREMANRFGRKKADTWHQEEIREKEVNKKRRKLKGRVMFPTTHGLTPNNINACLTVARNLAEAGNELLIVSKPHLDVILKLCEELKPHADRVEFRFTIGSPQDDDLSYWEPNAPCYEERMFALATAGQLGYRTSVSIEPMLCRPDHLFFLVDESLMTANGTVWIGKLNAIGSRVAVETDEDRRRVACICRWQTDDNIWNIYEACKRFDRIRWKESIKKIVGLCLAEKAGEDR